MDLKETEILGEEVSSHWYFQSKNLVLIDLIKKLNFDTVLDVGAGSAYFSKQILLNTAATEVICLDTGYTAEKDEIYNGKNLRFRKKNARFDAQLVIMMDVLEHVEEDVLFLKEYVQQMPSGTYFCITVPAFNFLFSPHDKFLGHFRRYSLNSLKSIMRKAELTHIEGGYFFLFLFPLVVLIRFCNRILSKYLLKTRPPKSDLKPHREWVNKLLRLANKLELKLVARNRICGLTVFCLGIKK